MVPVYNFVVTQPLGPCSFLRNAFLNFRAEFLVGA
jgi:hypothetical protein